MLNRTFALLLLLAACGTKDDATDTASDTGTSTAVDPTTTAPTTGTTASAGTTESADTSTTADSATDSGTTTLDEPTTTGPTTTDPTTTTTTTDETTTTTGDPVAFERYRKNVAAGPCPPNADCDGFIELLADGTLRVEKFGEVGDPVTEAAVDPADLDAAIAVFTDPALIALLDGPDPLCDPPTDVFEAMLVAIDGQVHDATTTFCDQPPIAAARARADELADKYAP